MLKGSRYELKIRRTPREIKMTTVLFLICSNLKIRRTYNRTRCADVDINISTLNVINYFGFMCSALECITFEEKKVITAERMQNIYSRAFYQKVACFAWINQQVLLLSSKLQGFLCKKKKKYIVFNQNALTTFFSPNTIGLCMKWIFFTRHPLNGKNQREKMYYFRRLHYLRLHCAFIPMQNALTF